MNTKIMEKMYNIQKMLSQLREDLKDGNHNFAGEKILWIQKDLKSFVEDVSSLIEAMEDNIKKKQELLD